MSQTIETERSFIAAAPAAEASRLATVQSPTESLFEHFAWLYVFFRENIFRDDTDRIIKALWSAQKPVTGTRLLELGCGPGFYSCELAARFPETKVLGVDRSEQQLQNARKKAKKYALKNCQFQTDNVLALSHPEKSFDVLIAARLFTVLPDQERAIAEMFRVLSPGGRCLIAEPRYAIWASLPLLAMWLLAGLSQINRGFCEPRRAIVLSSDQFQNLFASQPWSKIETWRAGRYQYALCEKG